MSLDEGFVLVDEKGRKVAETDMDRDEAPAPFKDIA